MGQTVPCIRPDANYKALQLYDGNLPHSQGQESPFQG